MGPVEALKIGIAEEEKAIHLYKKLGLEHKELLDIFDFLTNEEFKHKQLLEKRITELTKY